MEEMSINYMVGGLCGMVTGTSMVLTVTSPGALSGQKPCSAPMVYSSDHWEETTIQNDEQGGKAKVALD